jgi:hypothetical protein
MRKGRIVAGSEHLAVEGIQIMYRKAPPFASRKGMSHAQARGCATRAVENKAWAAPPANLLVARVKITSYNQHCSAPFFRALVVYRYQVYSVKGADAVIQSALIQSDRRETV